MDDMQQLLMRVLFEVTESRMETRQEFASFRKEVNERFDRLEGRVDTLESNFVTMDANMKAMDANMKAMDAKNNERFIQVHEHIDRVDRARIEGEERILKAIDLILDGSGLGQQIVQKKPTIVFRG